MTSGRTHGLSGPIENFRSANGWKDTAGIAAVLQKWDRAAADIRRWRDVNAALAPATAHLDAAPNQPVADGPDLNRATPKWRPVETFTFAKGLAVLAQRLSAPAGARMLACIEQGGSGNRPHAVPDGCVARCPSEQQCHKANALEVSS
jgi:hypothetical protein